MTVNAITDTKKGRTGIAPTYLHTTQNVNDYNNVRSEIRLFVLELCENVNRQTSGCLGFKLTLLTLTMAPSGE